MYYPKFYKGLTKIEIAKKVEEEGFAPILISDKPHARYPLHQHPEVKILAFIKGQMEITVGEKTYTCLPGDKIIVPGNTPHSGIVGQNGCVFFWSERLVSAKESGK